MSPQPECDQFDRERGATAVEYGLMVALIAGAVIGTLLLLGDPITGLYGRVDWW